MNIKNKEATAVINSLSAGVVPRMGIQHIMVGREKESDEIIKCLNDIKQGHSIFKFWIGDYGSGKSFMLSLLNTLALKQKFVTASADITPERRLYANDRKSVATYTILMHNLCIQTKTDGNALPTILEKWIETFIQKTADDNAIPFVEIRQEKYFLLLQNGMIKTLSEVSDVGGFDFGTVIAKYFEGSLKNNDLLKNAALKWLRGEYTTRTEARNDLGVRDIIDDHNYYDILKNLALFFIQIGYSGFIVNLDEAVNLYKITNTQVREKNYEKILTIYNDCYQNQTSYLFFNLAGTADFLENERRGLFSYPALKTRLIPNRYETTEIRDFSQPVIKLLPLDHNEIYFLLTKIKEIYDVNHSCSSNFNDKDINRFMECLYNKPGANEFLTPREVIKDFIDILNVLRQNPGIDKETLYTKIEIKQLQTDDISEVEEI